MISPKPFFVPIRRCNQCGVSHQRPFSYHKRTGWWLPGICHKCHFKKYHLRNKEARAAVRRNWMREQRKIGRYASGGRVGTFWAYPAARNRYVKLRRCGVDREEARSEALKIFLAHQKERPAGVSRA